jgi:hypothetical protein
MIIENPTRDRFETAMFVLLQLRIETTRRPRIASSSRAVKRSAHGRFHQAQVSCASLDRAIEREQLIARRSSGFENGGA